MTDHLTDNQNRWRPIMLTCFTCSAAGRRVTFRSRIALVAHMETHGVIRPTSR